MDIMAQELLDKSHRSTGLSMIKKTMMVLALFGLALCSGCQDLLPADTALVSPSQSVRNEEPAPFKHQNPYFPSGDNLSTMYRGPIFFFDTFGDIPIPICDAKVNFIQIASLKNGVLYQIEMDPLQDFEIPEERLSFGYFYVQEDKIIRIWDDRENPDESSSEDDNYWGLSEKSLELLIRDDLIPPTSEIVCQEKDIKDSLPDGEEGWHKRLVVDGDKREYHSWQQFPQHSGYWESFIWEKGIGLIEYRSGYRDGIDYIKLQKSE